MFDEEFAKRYKWDLTKSEAIELSCWIEEGLFNTIREDREVDNVYWVKKWADRIIELENWKDKTDGIIKIDK